MKRIVEIPHLIIHILVTLEFYLQINNCRHLPVVFSLISMGEKGNGIERRIQASKHQSRNTRDKKQARSQEHKNLVWRSSSCHFRQDSVYMDLV